MGGPARRYLEPPRLIWLSPSARPSAMNFPRSLTDHTAELRGGFITPLRRLKQTASLSHVQSLQVCPTLQPHGLGPPGSSVHGILQARTLKWAAISSSRGIFPTQGSNPCLLCLLHGQVGFQGSPSQSPRLPQLVSVRAKEGAHTQRFPKPEPAGGAE